MLLGAIAAREIGTLCNSLSDETDPYGGRPDQLFGLYGATALNLQYWTGTAWQTLSTLTGNHNVWMTFRFPAVSTTRLRLNITQMGKPGRIVAVEAYSASASATLYTYDALDQLLVVDDPMALTPHLCQQRR